MAPYRLSQSRDCACAEPIAADNRNACRAIQNPRRSGPLNLNFIWLPWTDHRTSFLSCRTTASLAASNPHALRRFVERAHRYAGVVFDGSRMLLVIQPVHRSVIEQIGDVTHGVPTMA